MSKAAMNLQDSFLNQVRRENSEVRILLVNGTLLRGIVKGFDNFTLILNNRNGQHLVYKHAIAQVVTHRPHIKSDGTAISVPEESQIESAADSTAPAPTEEQQAQAPRSEKPRKPHHPKPNSPSAKSNKEGFNKIDLSQVKLDDTDQN